MAEQELVWWIFSPHCFDLFTKFDVEHFLKEDCAAIVLSKLISYVIIYFSFAFKIPQISKIVSAKSGAGLSVISLIIESLGFLVTTAYFYRRGYPTSTYGESPIIFMQNMIILLLIFAYNKNTIMGVLLIIAYSGLFAFAMTPYLPLAVLQQISASNIAIVLGSKLPVIYSIYSAGSTGNYAFITYFLGFAGAVARLFTTLQEVDDMMALLVVSVSTACNGIIVLQFLIYWNVDKKKKEKLKRKKKQ
mmetsp:Transcript_33962/g.54414  ORF Transcript_33962/g.54414 Transcript_33962/m.54414 type:complete len:247 (+) Transcript_33962:36-776(+)